MGIRMVKKYLWTDKAHAETMLKINMELLGTRISAANPSIHEIKTAWMEAEKYLNQLSYIGELLEAADSED